MRKDVLLVLLVFISVPCFCQTLTREWTSDTIFLKPESALYDSSKQVIYVSNINGEYLAKDGNGFISRLKTNGEVDSLKWVEGLDNPQGMGLFENHLYVADINRVVQINTNTAKIEKVFEVTNAEFLNDITSDSNGDIYISDCFGNKIYRLTEGKIEVWMDDPFLSGPNGLLCTKDNILVLNMSDKTGYTINKQTRNFREFFNGIEHCDGIVSDGRNGYFVSGAWQGEVFHINSEGIKELVLDLGLEKIITADLEFIVKDKLLIIPTLNKTVIGYKWQ